MTTVYAYNQTIHNTFPSVESLVAEAAGHFGKTFSRFPLSGTLTADTMYLKSASVTLPGAANGLHDVTLVAPRTDNGISWVPYYTEGWEVVFTAPANIANQRRFITSINWGASGRFFWNESEAITFTALPSYYIRRPRVRVSYPFSRGSLRPSSTFESSSGLVQRVVGWSENKDVFSLECKPQDKYQSACLFYFLKRLQGQMSGFYLYDAFLDRFVLCQLQDDSFQMSEIAAPRLHTAQVQVTQEFDWNQVAGPYTGNATSIPGSPVRQTFIDTGLIDNYDIAPGWTLDYTDGSNVGMPRILTSFNATTGECQWFPPLPNAVLTSDDYRLTMGRVQVP